MSKLKLCPFCGEKLEKQEYFPLRYRFRHKDNGCFLEKMCVYDNEISKWNKRVSDE